MAYSQRSAEATPGHSTWWLATHKWVEYHSHGSSTERQHPQKMDDLGRRGMATLLILSHCGFIISRA